MIIIQYFIFIFLHTWWKVVCRNDDSPEWMIYHGHTINIFKAIQNNVDGVKDELKA